MRKLLIYALGAFALASTALAQSANYPAPAAPTTAQPTFLVNPATGQASGGGTAPSNPRVTPTITAGAYTAGFVLGGVMSFTVTTYGIVSNAGVTFNSGAYTGGVDLWLFDAAPTGGGYTDHAALALTATDMPKLVGVLHLTDCKLAGAATSQCQSTTQTQTFNLGTGTTLYGVAQVIGAPTFTGTTDAIFKLKAIQ